MGATGEHGILGGEPTMRFFGISQPGWKLIFHSHIAQNMGIAELSQHRAFRPPGEAGLEPDGAELVGSAAVTADHGFYLVVLPLK
jgi:hypothetical protein